MNKIKQDLKFLVGSPEFLRFVNFFVGELGFAKTQFSKDNNLTNFNLGMQNAGFMLYAMVAQHTNQLHTNHYTKEEIKHARESK